MRTITRLTLDPFSLVRTGLVAAVLALSVMPALAQTSDPAGHWEGTIQIPERELGVAVDLAKNAAGAWIGTITIPGATAQAVPLASVAVEDGHVRFIAMLPDRSEFDAALAADQTSFSGTASNAKGGVPFQMKRTGAADIKLPPASSASSAEFEGSWEGTLDAGGRLLRVGLTVSRGADGLAAATLISPDENQSIPITTVTIAGKQLQLESRAVSGTYKGALGPAGQIVGEWSQRGTALPLTFKRAPEAK